MHETMIRRVPILLVIVTILVTGCENSNENERVAEVATEAAERVAGLLSSRQRRQMEADLAAAAYGRR